MSRQSQELNTLHPSVKKNTIIKKILNTYWWIQRANTHQIKFTSKFKIEVNSKLVYVLNTKGNINHFLHELIFMQLMSTERSSTEHNLVPSKLKG